MRVAVDVSAVLNGRLSGVGYYTEHLLTALLAKGSPEHEWLLFSNRTNPALEAELWGEIRLQAGSRQRARQLWMQWQLPGELEASHPDICHFTNYLAPLRVKQPYVLTVYDMSVWLTPSCHHPKTLAVHRALTPISAKKARLVITISESARQDIIEGLGLPPEKVRVVYAGASPGFSPVPCAQAKAVAENYGLDMPYILTVGTLEPRKNHRRLLAAFKQIVEQERLPHHLVLVGGAGWRAPEFIREVQDSGLAGKVHLLGYVPREDLPALYSAASLFTFPSLQEGFGMPLLEAMACGTPSVISTAPALVEVAGGAALTAEATNVSDIAGAIYRVLSNSEEAERRKQLGLERARYFNWEVSAAQTIEIYREAAQTRQSHSSYASFTRQV